MYVIAQLHVSKRMLMKILITVTSRLGIVVAVIMYCSVWRFTINGL